MLQTKTKKISTKQKREEEKNTIIGFWRLTPIIYVDLILDERKNVQNKMLHCKNFLDVFRIHFELITLIIPITTN